MIHRKVSAFHLIFVQSQPLDTCSSSASLSLFSCVPEFSNRILQNRGKKKKKKEVISLNKRYSVCEYISKFLQSPMSLTEVLRRLRFLY